MGGFALDTPAHAEVPPAARRPLALLALQSHAVSRSYIAGQLWPDVPEERAAGNLRSALWRLRRTGFVGVERHGDALRLANWVTVDVRLVVAAATRLIANDRGRASTTGHDDEPLPPLADPAAFASELLPDWYDDWVVVERERVRQLCLHALEALTERLVLEHRFPEAIEAAMAAIRGEPLRESAHRALVRAHLAEGNRHEALRQYRQCRDLLERELGVPPSPLMRALLEDGQRLDTPA